MSSSFEQFGAFLIFRSIGRGGMGEVFVARTPWKDPPVAAVKRLRPDVARVANFAERFRREAELAVRLHHENVVGTIDIGSVNEQLYVASELILGKDTGHVGDRLRERRQGAPLAVVIRVLLDMLSALAYVHSAREPDGEWMRLVHRDITPGNVLLGYDGISRLADFGLAKSELEEAKNLTQHGEILGTPHYLAPEVIRGEPASPASDIYGLGAVMYRVLTGIAPFQGTAAEVLIKALKNRPKPLGDLRPDLPPWFLTVIHSMLDGDPIERPSDAGMLMRRIEHAAGRYKLLLPRASVGRWLSALFEEEKEKELEGYEEIAAVDVDDGARKPEGTVVLAAARSESRLEGDTPFSDQSLDDDTLLEAPLQSAELSIDETIQGAELVGLEQAQKKGRPSVDTKLTTEGSDSKPQANLAFSVDEDAETGNYNPISHQETPGLPGFIDQSVVRSVERGQVTTPHQSVQGEDKEQYTSREPEEAADEIADTQLPQAMPNNGLMRMPTKGQQRATTPVQNRATVWRRQDIGFLVAGLFLASIMGALVAVWATGGKVSAVVPKAILPNNAAHSANTAQTIAIEASLQARYRIIRSEMTKLNQRGVPMNPSMNKTAAQAADFLVLGQLEGAAEQIDQLEDMLRGTH